MKEFFQNKVRQLIAVLKVLFSIMFLLVVIYFVLKLVFNIQMPSWSWWSATFLSDNKVNSIITEVESSGYNIRKVQSIDAFGRVCTDTYALAGTSSDCDYPPEDKKDWSIEDYKKLIKK